MPPFVGPTQDPQELYRPLCGGIRIENPALGEAGSIGFFAGDAGRIFLVSCDHVLQGCHIGVPPGIYQPIPDPMYLVSSGAPREGFADCAAVELLQGVDWVNECLHLGQLGDPTPLVAGMPVQKCGAVTGVTEGIVTRYGTDLLVAPVAGASTVFPITDEGDSGALWVEAGTNRPVAIDRGAKTVAQSVWAVVVPVDIVLSQLGLTFPP